MAMTWTDITDDIIYQEGTFAFLYTAGEALKRGMAVKLSGSTGYVYKGDDNNEYGVGIAEKDASAGDPIAVWGKGNIVTSRASGAAANYTVGTAVGLGPDGYISYNNTTHKMGIVYEAPSATNGTFKVLLI